MTITIQQVIDTILQSVAETIPLDPSGKRLIPWGEGKTIEVPLPETVDTFKCGDPTRPVTGIVTTFIATRNVIEKAIELGANLIITHEPTYFNHLDRTDWLQEDPTYRSKRELLDSNGLIVWRFHDHWHIRHPDGIMAGFAKTLGWENCLDAENGSIFNLPEASLGGLVTFLKSSLGMPTLRVVGNLDMRCRRVAVVLGSAPGEWHIETLQKTGADTVICGETVEWQVCEYVRDATASGIQRALIVLGHEKSEEPGMLYLVDWLHDQFPSLPVTHVPAGDPYQFI